LLCFDRRKDLTPRVQRSCILIRLSRRRRPSPSVELLRSMGGMGGMGGMGMNPAMMQQMMAGMQGGM